MPRPPRSVAAPRKASARPAASVPAAGSARERLWRDDDAPLHEPEPLDVDVVEVEEVEEVEEIAELAEMGDEDEEITPTPSVPEEEESEW